MEYKITIYGAPRTKKNHGEVYVNTAGRFHMPSKAWRRWLANADLRWTDGSAPIFVWKNCAILPDQAVNCRALFYRDARRGDAVGYYQGLADLLEKKRVLQDDAQIVTWWGSRMLLDKSNPRVELVLQEWAQ